MCSITELVREIASVTGLEENFVSVYARAAREAGLVSHKGRGRNAAEMTSADAASVLIALSAGSLAKEAPVAIQTFRQLRLRSIYPVDTIETSRYISSPIHQVVSPKIDFGQALDRLIAAFIPDGTGQREAEAMFVDGTYYPQGGVTREKLIDDVFKDNRLEIQFSRPRRVVDLSFRMGEMSKINELPPVLWASYIDFSEKNLTDDDFGDRRQQICITARTLRAVGTVLAA